MSNQDKEDLQIRIRPIENGIIISGNAKGVRIPQRYYPDVVAARSALIDHIDKYLRDTDNQKDKDEDV